MTVTVFPDGSTRTFPGQSHDPTSLRAWLAGRWAILFSHPDDFAQEQLEIDRWISVVSRSFGELGVAPVALARAGRLPANLPSPLELIGWAVALRKRDRGHQSRHESSPSSLTGRPGWARHARYSLVQACRC